MPVKRRMKNNNGSVLIEVLAGMAIMSIMAIAFSATITQANFLFIKASYLSREWEDIFNKMESKEYSTMTSLDGTEFQMQIGLGTVYQSDIVLADGTNFGGNGTPPVDMKIARVDKAIIPNAKFRQYKATIESAQSPGTEDVYVYQIVK